MTKKKNIDYLHELASLRGGRRLSTEYINSRTKYEWECGKCGYRWRSTANSVKQGRWCLECSGKKKRDADWLYSLAVEKGGECLSVKYIDNSAKYEWECGKCGYKWWATANSIQQGCWCPECAGTKRKNIEWLCELASLKGGRCLSTEYINNQTKYEWECGEEHRWWASASRIQQGQWCPECYGNKRRDIAHLHKLAAQNNGKCLSTEYVNDKTKYEWGCDREHEWQATANDVNRGSWCPHCSHRHSRAELQIYEFVKELCPDALNGQRKLLSNPKFELDIYIPSLHKAIEFDGEFWHSTDEAQFRDTRKNQECEAQGIQLLRIQEQYFLDCPQQVFDIVKAFLEF